MLSPQNAPAVETEELVSKSESGISVKCYVPVISNRPKVTPLGALSRSMMQGRPGLSITCYSNDTKKETK